MQAAYGNPSLWQATAEAPACEPLAENTRADVVVVGAGIAGLSSAYVLAGRGRSVVVLDERGVGGGESARTTAHLANGLDDRYYELARLHGARGAQLAADSHAQAIATIEGIVRAESIDCDFERVPGYLIRADNRPADELERELQAAQRAGVDVEHCPELRAFGWPLGDALRFNDQAQMHPLRYLAGLAQAAMRRGVRVYGGTHAAQIRGGDTACVTTSDGLRVDAGAAIVATNTPVNDRVVIHTKQAAYRTFVIALELAGNDGAPCLIWDTADPYHYVRTWRDAASGSRWLIVGGEDHKTGQPPPDEAAAFARLQAWAHERFGADGEVRYAWSGQILEPNDGLAFIGRNPLDDDNVFVVTGDSGNGMTHGTLAALLLADLIEERANPWAELYSPSRKHGLGEFVRENANVAVQYAELATGGEVASAREIERGGAAIIREGLHKLAVYRDDDGELHAHSASCTHLRCIVHWNAVERTWDCPCHGSRFDPIDGHVLNGPANAPLAAAEPAAGEARPPSERERAGRGVQRPR